jgi:hypothetical protein
VQLEGLGKLEQFNDLIGTRTRDLPACSVALQPTTLPRATDILQLKTKNTLLPVSCTSCHVLASEFHDNERRSRYQSLFQKLSLSANYKLHFQNGRDKIIHKKIRVTYNPVKGKKASNFITSRRANFG